MEQSVERFLLRTTPMVLLFLFQAVVWFGRTVLPVLAGLAVRVSLACLRPLSPHWPSGATATGAVALASGALWVLLGGIIVGIASRSGEGVIVGALGGLAVAIPMGIQLQRWLLAASGAQHRGNLVLGSTGSSVAVISHPAVLSFTERFKAVAVNGATGSGKSTWITNAVVADIRQGIGVGVIDPKDNLVDLILPHIPAERERDVILFDATDLDRPLGFNPLAGVAPARRSLATSELLAVFHRYFAAAWGNRMEHILSNTILALLETPGSTLLDIPRFLLNAERREEIVGRVENIGVRQFFQVEFEQMLRGRGDALEPILNKVGPWLTYPELRHIMGQPTSSFEVRQLMDEGKILLAQLPVGELGDEISGLLASLLVAKIQLAAHSRVDTPAAKRRPFILYLDEAHNYANSSLERILVESRAFKLGMVVANQYPEQLSRELQLAITKNAATRIQCLVSQGHYGVQVTRLEEEIQHRPPRLLRAAPPLPAGDPGRATDIRTLSRTHYGRPRAEVEQEILARLRLGQAIQPQPARKPVAARAPRAAYLEEE